MAHIELMTDEQFEIYVQQFSEEKRARLRRERDELLKPKEEGDEDEN